METYSKKIQRVHDGFNHAADALLEQVKKLVDRNAPENKINRLKGIGFKSVKQVKENMFQEWNLTDQMQLVAASNQYKVDFPGFKFITYKQAAELCKKYKLVIGAISEFTGFVPEKNLQQIEEFRDNFRDKIFTPHHITRITLYSHASSKENHARLRTWQEENPFVIGRTSNSKLSEKIFGDAFQISNIESELSPSSFQIAAPKGDFIDTGKKTVGHVLMNMMVISKDPDPIVMYPVDMGYIIITAWGDEASDPIVNHHNN